MSKSGSAKYILYADDDSDDREVLTELMQTIDGDLLVVTVNNGQQLMEYLDRLDPGAKLPCFIILDINMPVMNGIETLSSLKSVSSYENIPVFMYTTSEDPVEMEKARRLQAKGFIVKPFDYADMKSVTTKFAAFCNSNAELNK